MSKCFVGKAESLLEPQF